MWNPWGSKSAGVVSDKDDLTKWYANIVTKPNCGWAEVFVYNHKNLKVTEEVIYGATSMTDEDLQQQAKDMLERAKSAYLAHKAGPKIIRVE